MKIIEDVYPLSVSKKLIAILEKEIEKSGLPGKGRITIIFKDLSYSPMEGGFHPVEIAISPEGAILHITDFSFTGFYKTLELRKELDFDFELKTFQQFGSEYPISRAKGIYKIWQLNFCSYYMAESYDSIEVKEED